MADESRGSRWGTLLIVLALFVLLAWVAWQFGLFGTAQEQAASPGE